MLNLKYLKYLGKSRGEKVNKYGAFRDCLRIDPPPFAHRSPPLFCKKSGVL